MPKRVESSFDGVGLRGFGLPQQIVDHGTGLGSITLETSFAGECDARRNQSQGGLLRALFTDTTTFDTHKTSFGRGETATLEGIFSWRALWP